MLVHLDTWFKVNESTTTDEPNASNKLPTTANEANLIRISLLKRRSKKTLDFLNHRVVHVKLNHWEIPKNIYLTITEFGYLFIPFNRYIIYSQHNFPNPVLGQSNRKTKFILSTKNK